MRLPSLILFAFTSFLLAEEPTAPEPVVKPNVERMDATRFRIEDLEFDSKTREIRFPALVNMNEGLLEFLITHQNGKIHETLFRTPTSPSNLNLALTLLHYKPSKELYRIPSEPGLLTEEFYKVPEDVRAAAQLRIDVEYEKDGEITRLPASDWIQHDPTAKAMPPTHWVYGGSEFYDGKFVPETTGDIAAIFITNSSLINYPGDQNTNDTVWSVFTSRVPEPDTKVTIVIAPHTDTP